MPSLHRQSTDPLIEFNKKKRMRNMDLSHASFLKAESLFDHIYTFKLEVQ